MKNIIFTWELGGGSGHISEMMPLAKKFDDQQYHVSLLLKDVIVCNLSRLGNMKIFQSPLWLSETRGFPEPAISFSETLLRFGYHDPIYLHRMVLLWINTLKALKADIVIATFSPTAMLAARILRLPVFTLGTGYYVPPHIYPLPLLSSSTKAPPHRLEEADDKVTSVINEILHFYDMPPIPHLTGLFEAKKHLFLTYPEIDHYDTRTKNPDQHIFLGPILDLDFGEDVFWSGLALKKIFVYLRPHNSHYKEIILALKTLPCEYIVCIPGISSHEGMELESNHGQVFSSPVKFRHLLKDCDLAIGYGGHGFTSCMLTYGVPQIMLPVFTEQYILGLKMEALGAGKMLTEKLEQTQYANVISDILNNGSYKTSAMKVASKYTASPEERLDRAFLEVTSVM